MGKHHDKKDVSKAIQDAIDAGMVWHKEKSGHIAGKLECPHGPNPECPYGGCIFRVSSTPRSQQAEAKKIRGWIKRCRHDDREDT